MRSEAIDGLGRMPVFDAAGGVILPSRQGRRHRPLARLVESGRGGAATGCGEPAQAEAGTSGLYRQVKLLLHSDHVETLEGIRDAFAKRKPESHKPLTVGQLVTAAVGFMIRHVDFSGLQSADDLDRHVTAYVSQARLRVARY